MVIAAIVPKLAVHVSRSKFNPISPYLFHIYHHTEVLNNPEVVAYDTKVTVLKYGLIDKVETENPESEEEEEFPEEK